MKRERPYKTAYKAWANGMLDVISAALCKLFNVSFDYLFSTDQAN